MNFFIINSMNACENHVNKRKSTRSGFTLAELLVVVAIISVLVAIMIPVFQNQLEKSREATDISNVRAAYAEVSENPCVECVTFSVIIQTFSDTIARKRACPHRL